MIFEFLKALLGFCKFLGGYDIRCDMLGEKNRSVSLIPTGNNKVIRAYADGERIIGTEFDIVLRLKLNDDNCDNYNLTDNLILWLSNIDFSQFKALKAEYSDFFTPISLTIIDGAYLKKDDIRSGQYKIRCRIDCLFKKRAAYELN